MNNLLNSIRNYIQDDLLYELLIFVLIIILTIIIAKIICFVIKKIVAPIVKKTSTKLDDLILEVVHSSLFKIILIGGFYSALGVFKGSFNLVSLKSNKTLVLEHPYLLEVVNIADHILFILLIFIFLLISFKITNIFIKWYADKINAEENKNLSGSLFPLLNKVAKILLSILSLAIILAKFKVDISGFVVSLGVGSLAIALAAQETISNMISGFMIMADRPFRIGDRIRIGTEITGDVIEIGIRSTKILDFDNNILIIPNNEIAKSRIINLSYPDSSTRVLINVGIAYGSDLEKVKKIMFNVVEDNPMVDHNSAYDFGFLNFGDYSLQVRLGVRAKDYKYAYDLSNQLRTSIYNEFLKEGIEIPFPQRVVYNKNLNEKTNTKEV